MLRYYGPFQRRSNGKLVSESWYLKLYDTNTRHARWISTRQKDKRKAEAYRRYLEDEALIHPARRASSAQYPTGEIADSWLADCRRTLSPLTIANLASFVRRVKAHFRGPIADLTPERITAYLDQRRKSCNPRTCNQDRTLFRWMCHWAIQHKKLWENPVDSVRPYKVAQRDATALSEEEERALLRRCEENGALYACVVVALDTGLRLRALSLLRWSMVAENWLNVPAELLKSNRSLRIPLSTRASLALQRCPRDVVDGCIFGMCRAVLARRIKRACKLAGLPQASTHTLRRTFLTRCRERGVPLEVAMRISDHRDVTTALRCYRAIADDEMRHAVETDDGGVTHGGRAWDPLRSV